MKKIAKAVYRFFYSKWLRSDLRLWEQTIEAELQRRENHADIMRQLYWQKARVQSELDRVEGRNRVSYSFGPTLRQK